MCGRIVACPASGELSVDQCVVYTTTVDSRLLGEISVDQCVVYTTTVDSRMLGEISVDQCVVVSLTVFYMMKSVLISV